MLLAELEIHHSRPAQPTRRLALGHLVLPVDPPPGLGGVLLGAVVAEHSRSLGADDLADIGRLLIEVENGHGLDEEARRSGCRVSDHLAGLRVHHCHHQFDDVTRRSELVITPLFSLHWAAGSSRWATAAVSVPA